MIRTAEGCCFTVISGALRIYLSAAHGPISPEESPLPPSGGALGAQDMGTKIPYLARRCGATHRPPGSWGLFAISWLLSSNSDMFRQMTPPHFPRGKAPPEAVLEISKSNKFNDGVKARPLVGQRDLGKMVSYQRP